MPGCPYGATTRPELVGVRTWLNADTVEIAVKAFLDVKFPNWQTAVASQLIDFVDLCELNPDPPPPFDVSILLNTTQGSIFGPATPLASLGNWLASYLQYQSFLLNCVCLAAPTDPTHNCAAIPPSFGIGSLGAIAGPWPVTIDQVVIDSWAWPATGDWSWNRSGQATVDSGAHSGNGLDVQLLLVNGSWTTVDDIQTLNQFGSSCSPRFMAAVTPKFNSTTQLRLVNNAGGTHTVTNMTYCFCASTIVAPPLPPFEAPTNVPDPPAALCSTADLCRMITELNRRLTVMSSQVSDIQAALIGHDQLVVLSSQQITGEGEVLLVQGTRAVSVELIALSDDAYTSALGRPRGLMRVGSIRWFDGIGYSPRRFIDADRFDDIRPVGALSISWQLLPDATAILKFLG